MVSFAFQKVHFGSFCCVLSRIFFGSLFFSVLMDCAQFVPLHVGSSVEDFSCCYSLLQLVKNDCIHFVIHFTHPMIVLHN